MLSRLYHFFNRCMKVFRLGAKDPRQLLPRYTLIASRLYCIYIPAKSRRELFAFHVSPPFGRLHLLLLAFQKISGFILTFA
jgi:hypothetical protein